jgi:hypothetical protein
LPAHTLSKLNARRLPFSEVRLPAAAHVHWSVIVIEPKQSDIGRNVIYRVYCAAKAEEGVITRFNKKYVFVRFGKEEKSAVTTREQLEWKHARLRSSGRD